MNTKFDQGYYKSLKGSSLEELEALRTTRNGACHYAEIQQAIGDLRRTDEPKDKASSDKPLFMRTGDEEIDLILEELSTKVPRRVLEAIPAEMLAELLPEVMKGQGKATALDVLSDFLPDLVDKGDDS